MKRVLLITILLMLSIGTTYAAEQWEYVAPTGKYEGYIDVNSVKNFSVEAEDYAKANIKEMSGDKLKLTYVLIVNKYTKVWRCSHTVGYNEDGTKFNFHEFPDALNGYDEGNQQKTIDKILELSNK